MYCPGCKTLYTGALTPMCDEIKTGTNCPNCQTKIISDVDGKETERLVKNHVCMYDFFYDGTESGRINKLESFVKEDVALYNYKVDGEVNHWPDYKHTPLVEWFKKINEKKDNHE